LRAKQTLHPSHSSVPSAAARTDIRPAEKGLKFFLEKTTKIPPTRTDISSERSAKFFLNVEHKTFLLITFKNYPAGLQPENKDYSKNLRLKMC
jgi:hypothetical protein